MFLEINNIHKFYGEGENRAEVLKGVSAGLERGQICVLLGPSGSGKSTLLNIIGGIERADDGFVAVDGERTGAMKEKQLALYRRRHLGYVFQFYNLIPNLTVRKTLRWERICQKIPWTWRTCFKRWDFGNIRIKFQASFQGDSSRELLSGGQSSRIPIYCCATSRRVLWTINPQKKFCGSSKR